MSLLSHSLDHCGRSAEGKQYWTVFLENGALCHSEESLSFKRDLMRVSLLEVRAMCWARRYSPRLMLVSICTNGYVSIMDASKSLYTSTIPEQAHTPYHLPLAALRLPSSCASLTSQAEVWLSSVRCRLTYIAHGSYLWESHRDWFDSLKCAGRRHLSSFGLDSSRLVRR